MAIFFRRFMGALALDAAAFEDIEADRHGDLQSVAVLLMACAAGGVGAIGVGATGLTSFVVGALMVLTAWLLWVGIISTVGTTTLAEPDTHSNVHELLRVLGYATAPGIFLALASMRSVAPLMIAIVCVWIVAAAVLGVRQALDYRSTARAVAVCAIALAVAVGAMAVVALLFSQNVS